MARIYVFYLMTSFSTTRNLREELKISRLINHDESKPRLSGNYKRGGVDNSVDF
jgi:hypothetical protein